MKKGIDKNIFNRIRAGEFRDVQIGAKRREEVEAIRSLKSESSYREAVVVLLGDSTIDNESYVAEGQDTVTQAKALCGSRLVSFARDGARINTVELQLVDQKRAGIQLPHTVLSVGGNDIVGIASRFHDKSDSSWARVVRDIHEYKSRFELEYNTLAYALASKSSALTLCTVYKPNFTSFTDNQLATTLLPVFNQVIHDAAQRYSATLIDLYSLVRPDWITCNIEPSAMASLVFAHAIQRHTQNTVQLAA